MKAFKIKHIHPAVLVGIVLVAIAILVGAADRFFPHSGYVLFLYLDDGTTKASHIAEVESGFSSLRSCQERGVVFNSSINGRPHSFFRCAQGCPLSADTERDCKNPGIN